MTEIFADGADFSGIVDMATNPNVTGFTTNPTLMRAAGVANYRDFALDIMTTLKSKRPETNISLEVFADDIDGMIKQAKIIHQWSCDIGYTAYVKIPITNTQGISTYPVIENLSREGIRCNITAVFTPNQVDHILPAIVESTPTIISVFCGRIADAGQDPVRTMQDCMTLSKNAKYQRHQLKFLWASPREVYNYVQANEINCDIITMPPDLIKKMANLNKDLKQFSLETVQMFYRDAMASQYTIG